MGLSKKQMEALQGSASQRAVTQRASERKGAFESHAVNLPQGVSAYKLRVGTHKLDIMGHFPGPDNMDCDEDHFIGFCRYWIHWGLGADGKTPYRCPARAKHPKRCAVCEWVAKNDGSADPKLVKDRKAKERWLWAVVDLNEKDKGVQILDNAPYKGLGDEIEAMLKAREDAVNYASPLVGMTLSVIVEEEPIGDGMMKAVTRVDPVPRKKQYDKSVLDEIPKLDQCLVTPTYKELLTALNMGVDPEADEEEAPSNGKSRHIAQSGSDYLEDDADDDVNEDEEPEEEEGLSIGDTVLHKRYGKCTVVKIQKSGAVNVVNEDEDLIENVRPITLTKLEEDADEEGEEAEEEPVAQKKGKGAGKSATRRKPPVEDDDDDEAAPEEDDEPEEDEDEEETAFDDEDELPKKKTRRK